FSYIIMNYGSFKIFKSKLKLSFQSEELETLFQDKTNNLILKYNSIYLAFFLVASTACSIFESLDYDLYHNQKNIGILYTLYGISSILFIFLIISLIFSKRLKIQVWMNYINYFLIPFMFASVRH